MEDKGEEKEGELVEDSFTGIVTHRSLVWKRRS